MSKGRNQAQIPAFLQKTYDILENQELVEIVSWNEDGTGFLVKNVLAFQDKVLPMYFKHKNFASFVRQMNMYGFHKSRSDYKENEFIHPYFKRDQRNLLKKIKRKANEQDDIVAIPQELKPVRTQHHSMEVNELLNKQHDLEGLCKLLIDQNHKIIQYNRQLRAQLLQEKLKGKQKQQKIKDYLCGNQVAYNESEDHAMVEPFSLRNHGNIQQSLLKLIVSDDEEEGQMKTREDIQSVIPKQLMITNTEHDCPNFQFEPPSSQIIQSPLVQSIPLENSNFIQPFNEQHVEPFEDYYLDDLQ